MAVILAGERAVWGKKPRLRGWSVFAIKRKRSCVRHLTIESVSQDLNRRERLSLVACLLNWTLDAGEKLSERDPESAMANRYLREAEQHSWWNELQSADYPFRWGETRTSPAEHFLSCVSFQHVHFVLPESVKAYSFNLNDSSFVGQFLSSFFAFFITPSLRPFSLFPHFTWVSNEDNDVQSESFSPHSKKAGFYVFKASRSSKKEQNFPWGACLSAVRAIVAAIPGPHRHRISDRREEGASSRRSEIRWRWGPGIEARAIVKRESQLSEARGREATMLRSS